MFIYSGYENKLYIYLIISLFSNRCKVSASGYLSSYLISDLWSPKKAISAYKRRKQRLLDAYFAEGYAGGDIFCLSNIKTDYIFNKKGEPIRLSESGNDKLLLRPLFATSD